MPTWFIHEHQAWCRVTLLIECSATTTPCYH